MVRAFKQLSLTTNVCYTNLVNIVNPVLLATLADFCINISAGWFGAAFIVPVLSKRKKSRFVSLTINLLLSMMFLIVAFGLRVL